MTVEDELLALVERIRKEAYDAGYRDALKLNEAVKSDNNFPLVPRHILTNKQATIFRYVALGNAASGKISTDVLFDLLYGDDPNGGPLTGKKSLYTTVCYLNKRLQAHKQPYRVRSSAGGRNSSGFYELERLEKGGTQ